jgi:uracil-DNA glycosylase family 4
MQLSELENKIIKCKKCPRLVKFRNKIAKEKRKQYINENYWGKPITGFGNLNAKILIVGLAPAAHGGNRTGRVFTGDKSSDFLYKCLFKANISNQSNSDNKHDGLRLKNTYITTALKCVPPGDKPHPLELKTCFKYFKEEINLLNKSRVIIALGKIAFDACISFYKSQYNLTNQKYNFSHGINYILPDNKILIGCYHPSPRNVNTKRININKMVKLFNKAKTMI